MFGGDFAVAVLVLTVRVLAMCGLCGRVRQGAGSVSDERGLSVLAVIRVASMASVRDRGGCADLPPHGFWHARRVGLAVGGALALAGLGGCDRSDGAGGGAATPSLSAPPQSTRATAEQRALAAYEGVLRARAKAGLTANPNEPDLARHASGQALAALQEGLAGYREECLLDRCSGGARAQAA